MRIALMMVVVAASACVTTRASVTPIEIAQQARVIVQEGRAEVTGSKGVVRVSADELADVRVREGNLERPMRVSVRELVAGCVDGVGAPACLAARTAEIPALERRRLEFDGSRAASAIGFGLIGGALGLCLAVCDGDADLGNGLALTGGIAAGTAALFLLIVLVGH